MIRLPAMSAIAFAIAMGPAFAEVSSAELDAISIPDRVETAIGTLEFFDGVPTDATVATIYDNLDRMRGMQVFLDNIGAVSMYAVRTGLADAGAKGANRIALFADLMDSQTLVVTANTSTLYAYTYTDLAEDGPTVIEVPPGMLGFLNDGWQRFVGNMGVTGPDAGKGGKYLVVPPGYTGDIPDGYFLLTPSTNRNFLFLRGSIAKGLEPAVKNITANLKVYPLKDAENPAETAFENVSNKAFNTVFPSDYSYFEILDRIVQEEPIAAIGPEARGAIAAIGIVKGKPFAPDDRMKKLLTEAATLANATARAITYHPRIDGVRIYPDNPKSVWSTAFANKNTSFEADGAVNRDARALYYFNAGGVTPAMATSSPGKGSDYALAVLDAEGQAFDGAKTYRLHLPKDVPVKDFWAVTVYDTQTRSQLQTGQPFPTIGSQTKGMTQNADGSYDVYFAPEAPTGKEGNWLQTVPGKSWFTILRMYGPTEPWIDQSWRPGEIELVK
ncbi:hypothetical protein ACSSV4_004536 [Roseovarius sp. MBR-154]|jgi:hypothetical protein